MGVKRAIHDKPKTQFKNLNISRNNTKSLMKFLHQIAIKCLAYLILNKRKPDHKHTPWPTAHGHDNTITLYNCGTMTLWSPPFKRRAVNHILHHSQSWFVKVNGFTFHAGDNDHQSFFSPFFCELSQIIP